MATDDERFEELFRAHYERVLAYALRRTSQQTAEDVVSDVFATAWRRIDRVPVEALPWLLAVARRALANQRRGARRRDSLLEVLRDGTRALTPSASDSTSDAVSAALAALRETDRELLTLVAWDGLTPAEAAHVLGTSPATCRVRLHRARRRFEEALDASLDPHRTRLAKSIAKERSA